mgnify:FL=1
MLEATLINDILMNGRDVMTTIYDFQAELLEGEQKNLADYQGKVLLVVNTASQCGLTPQFEGLSLIHI